MCGCVVWEGIILLLVPFERSLSKQNHKIVEIDLRNSKLYGS